MDWITRYLTLDWSCKFFIIWHVGVSPSSSPSLRLQRTRSIMSLPTLFVSSPAKMITLGRSRYGCPWGYVWLLVLLHQFLPSLCSIFPNKVSDPTGTMVRRSASLHALYFSSQWSQLFSSQIFTSAHQSETTVSLIIYLVCLIGGGEESYCRDTLNSEVPLADQYGLASAATFFMAASGTFLILFFATHRKIFTLLSTKSVAKSTTPQRDSMWFHRRAPNVLFLQ